LIRQLSKGVLRHQCWQGFVSTRCTRIILFRQRSAFHDCDRIPEAIEKEKEFLLAHSLGIPVMLF
jgi:hypothetical protein